MRNLPIIGLALALGCACSTPAEVARSSEAIIYGTDNRLDVYAASTPHQQLSREAIVALITADKIDATDPMDVAFINTSTLGDGYDLCDDQAFRDQPAAGDCSGTLIDDDLVLTAGHCFDNADPVASCRNFRFVFNYLYSAEGTLATIEAARDVYSCRQLVTRRLEEVGDELFDYAVVQLDRPVDGAHVPAPIQPGNDPLAVGSALTIIGFGSGIPAKVDTGGVVVSARASTLDYFTGTTDSFGGNSGSGVFNDAGSVIGILVRGATDYVARGDCQIVNTVGPDPGPRGGEGISYVSTAITALCATGWTSMRVCGMAASCGDGMCAGGETPATCPGDCAAASCGDDVCDSDETEASCPADCTAMMSMIPAAWDCPLGFYGAHDECDCDCGAPDPDCNDLAVTVAGCDIGQTCSAAGLCEGTPIDVPAAWECDPEFYMAADGCDCDCGAPDPDCDIAGAEVFNCDDGQTCRMDVCVGAGVDAGSTGSDGGGTPGADAGTATGTDAGTMGTEGSGCRVRAGTSKGAPLAAFVAMSLLVWSRRRRV